MTSPNSIVIIGAGPYALSAAAFLQRAGLDPRLFGEVMGFWRTMPTGMFLRSYRRSSNIADPDGSLTIPAYEASSGRKMPVPIPLADFIAYGEWFRQQAKISVDPRRITHATRNGDTFRLELSDGDTVEAKRVVVAGGITPFAWRPPLFEGLDPQLVSHSSEHRDYSAFQGRRVAVLGGGQSALEAAAFLHGAGASTELIVRRQSLHFLRGEKLNESTGPVSNLLYPAWGVGPPGVNLLMGRPALFRRLPRWMSDPLARRAIRPAGASWLHELLEGVRMTTGRSIAAVEASGAELRLRLGDGDERLLDHVVLGTGYRLDLHRYSFLAPELVDEVRLIGSYPKLSSSYESSVRGLHFLGAPAAASAGPGMRFVSHTGFAAAAITKGVLSRS